MRRTWRKAAIVAAMIVAMGKLKAQVQYDAFGNYWLEPTNPTPQSFAIGPAATTGFALDVRGDLLSPQTGEVFRTDAPANANTNWRLLRGGTEYGRLFNEVANAHLGLDAPEGHLRLQTNGLLRVQVNTTQNSTINGFTVPTDGFVGLGRLAAAGTAPGTPWTRLHLHDVDAFGTVVALGYRDWMRNGVTMTGHGDHMYIGHKYGAGAGDATDAIFQWADNSGSQQGPDLMRFIFTGSYLAAASGENSLFGREIMQLHPQGRIGLGDWNAASVALGSTVSPTERLDVLDGRVRIRQLPDDDGTEGKYKVMVVDDSSDPDERGVVKWKDINLDSDCDWVVQTPDPHVSNTYDGSDCAWSSKHGVGIGLAVPKFKLHVYHTENTLLSPVAIHGDARFDLDNGSELFGLLGQARPTGSVGMIFDQQAYGGAGVAINSRASIGLRGFGSTCTATEGLASKVIGVVGDATGCGRALFVAGLYGEGSGAVDPADTWAAYINGRGWLTNGPWQPSDQQLKTNIQPMTVTDDTDPVLDIPVYSYQYAQETFPSMHLPGGTQVGFLAQDLEGVLPGLVTDMTHPAMLDSLGNETAPAVDLKAINPTALIPYLVLTVQRQQQRIDQMAEQLAGCCANPDGRQRIEPLDEGSATPATDRLLRIVPNPFSEPPMVHYTLERGGRTQLLVNGGDGRGLRVLHEAAMQPGSYQLLWDTNALAPGMYYVTLLLEGEPLVQKAVKVAR